MLFGRVSKTVFIFLFAISLGLTQVIAQETKTPFIVKGIFWFDKASETEIYLFPHTGPNYRLMVISPKAVKVTYHTKINSYEAVDKELTAKETSVSPVKTFEFDHHFSKMTIWMSLEFTVDGKKIPALTRTFYDNIFETVENERFFNPSKKKTN